jgi:hypothetical protein
VRPAPFVLVLALWSGPAMPSAEARQAARKTDPAKLELVRKLTPEMRALLAARLAELKTLPESERQRLKDNLTQVKSMSAEELKQVREKAQKLTSEEQKQYSELASGFFRWSQRMGYGAGFPRGMFFQWLKAEKPDRMERIRAMPDGPGSPRVEEFLGLSHEFRQVALSRTEVHLAKHRCGDPAELVALRDLAPPEFWPRWQELNRSCQARKAQPGPVAPRPLTPTGK